MSSPEPDASTRPGVSGVVICFNEEETIARCLESLSWCDEIVVVDSHSTDRTREIALGFTDRFIEQEFLGYVKQKNFALERAAHDWVVCLDADEALSDELRSALPKAIASAPPEVSGFVLDRINFFLGIWHDHGEWYPDDQLRAFRRSRGHWEGRDPHDRVALEGEVRRVPGRLLHWNYRDLSEHIETVDRFSALLAREAFDAGERFRLRDLVFRPLLRFLRGYLIRGGFRCGLPGFLVSISTAYYVFMKYAKLWELQRPAARPRDGAAGRRA